MGNTMTAAAVRTQLAVASAIQILAQREAAFEVHHLTKTALDLGLRGVDLEFSDLISDQRQLVTAWRW
jgi:hypothetical protein